MSAPAADRTGQRYGRGVVQRLTTRRSLWGHRYWELLCDCGRRYETQTGNLSNGTTKSCGCLRGIENRSRRKGGSHGNRQ